MSSTADHCTPSTSTPTTGNGTFTALQRTRLATIPCLPHPFSSNNSAPYDPVCYSDSTSAVSVLLDSCSPQNIDSGIPLQSSLNHNICNIQGYRDCQWQSNHSPYVSLVGIPLRRPFLLVLLPPILLPQSNREDVIFLWGGYFTRETRSTPLSTRRQAIFLMLL